MPFRAVFRWMPLFLILALSLNCPVGLLHAQKVLANNDQGLMVELNLSGSDCKIESTFEIKHLNIPQYVFSSCLLKDTLYFVTGNPYHGIGRYILSQPTRDPIFLAAGRMTTNYNSMAISPEGIIYLADFQYMSLVMYNTRTDEFRFLGTLPFTPSGDLMFYKGRLLLASGGAIVDVNTTRPEFSTVWMQTQGYSFFGLIGIPFSCNENKYYGIGPGFNGTTLVELDLDNKIIGQPKCTMPVSIWDGASAVDGGFTAGAQIADIQIDGVCAGQTIDPVVKVKAVSASVGDLTYTLDGNRSNNTGFFDKVSLGAHSIRIQTSMGCITDSTFEVAESNPLLSLAATLPTSCGISDGKIMATAQSPYPPFSFRAAGGSWQSSPQISNLGFGTHTIEMRDKAGCAVSAVSSLQSPAIRPFLQSIQATPAYCNLPTGKISVQLTPNAQGILASLNGAAYGSHFNFTNLKAGRYIISLKDNLNCVFDSTIEISNESDPAPLVVVNVQDQICASANGLISLNISGQQSPYLTRLGMQGNFSDKKQYGQLAPGDYVVWIQNSNGCEWQQAATVGAYPFSEGTINPETVAADCDHPAGGSIRLNVDGPRGPYEISRDGQNWQVAGGLINNLTAGEYLFSIRNADGCIEKTNYPVSVVQELTGNCDFFYVPNAFTPNGDGLNETVKPFVSPVFSKVEWTVFNRFGQMVYSWRPGQPGWDGRYKGLLQPSGAFVWKASYLDVAGKPVILKGFINLIR